MNRSARLLFVLLLTAAILIAACNRPTITPTDPIPTDPVPTPTIELAVIAGVVWHDRCFIDWEGGGPPPPGCVEGDPYPVGDGVRTEDEPGIPGVTVSFVYGECPLGWDMGLSHDVHSPTNANGEYYQWLGPGTYCFSVLRFMGDNPNIFNGGYWTAPGRGDTFSYFPKVTITVGDGEVRADVDFGYDFLFGSSTTPASITGRVWNDINTDGIVDPTEPGLWDVEVWLTLGTCSTDYLLGPHITTITALDGTYAFNYLNPGPYCLVINLDEHPNIYVLHDGVWTVPSGGSDTQLVDVILTEGQVRADSNFGWHFFLSGYRTPTPVVWEPTIAVEATPEITIPMPTLQILLPTLEFIPPTSPFMPASTATPTLEPEP